MDRWRSSQNSGSEIRSLRTAASAGLAQFAGLHHPPAPTGVRRGTASDGNGWFGSKAVKNSESGRGRRSICVVAGVLTNVLDITLRDL